MNKVTRILGVGALACVGAAVLAGTAIERVKDETGISVGNLAEWAIGRKDFLPVYLSDATIAGSDNCSFRVHGFNSYVSRPGEEPRELHFLRADTDYKCDSAENVVAVSIFRSDDPTDTHWDEKTVQLGEERSYSRCVPYSFDEARQMLNQETIDGIMNRYQGNVDAIGEHISRWLNESICPPEVTTVANSLIEDAMQKADTNRYFIGWEIHDRQ